MNGCSACSLVKSCGMDKNFPCPFMGDREIKPSDIKRIEHKEDIMPKIFGVDLFARSCHHCDEEFNEGILDERDGKTYCDYKCAAEDMTAEELKSGIIDDELFYTEWEEDDCDDDCDDECDEIDTPPDDYIGEEEQAELDSAAEDKYFNRD